MMTAFTPVEALIGGALIGLAAGLLWLGLGRVMGVSGILGTLLTGPAGGSQDVQGRAWRAAFLLGTVAAPVAWLVAGNPIAFDITTSPVLLIAGGLLVGLGTRIGAGCTSGHGVCGLARGSLRSLVATLIFMGVAVVTVLFVRPLAL